MSNFACNNATQLNSYCCKPFQSDTNAIKGVKILCYCVLLLMSVIGNTLLVAIIKTNKRLQTITNYLIANVAASDIINTLLVVPRKITEILLGPRSWLVSGLLGSILCKSISFLQDITTAVSIISLVVITTDRYRGIVFPFQKQLMGPAKLCKVIIPLIWIVSMPFHLVYFDIFHTETNNGETTCRPLWSPESQKTSFTVIFVCLIVVPACVITFLYLRIIHNLKRNRAALSQGPLRKRLKEDVKVVRNIIAILVVFVACMTPISIYGMLVIFVWDKKVPCGIENYGFAAHFILYTNASVNPWIYFVLNDKYRRCFGNILRKLRIVRKEKKSRGGSPLALEMSGFRPTA